MCSWAVFCILYTSFPQTKALIWTGATTLAATYFYSFGLKYCGPVRTILLNFYSHCFPLVWAAWAGSAVAGIRASKRMAANKYRGMIIMIMVYVILLVTAESSVHDSGVPVRDSSSPAAVASAQAIPNPAVSTDGQALSGTVSLGRNVSLLNVITDVDMHPQIQIRPMLPLRRRLKLTTSIPPCLI